MAKRASFNSDVDYHTENLGDSALHRQQEAASLTWEYSSSDDFDYPSTIIPKENQEDAPTDPEHVNVTIAVNDNEFDQEIAGYDDELALVESAFEYLTKKKYPPGCSKNHKRIIRRKAERLEERNGEILFYKKRHMSRPIIGLPNPARRIYPNSS